MKNKITLMFAIFCSMAFCYSAEIKSNAAEWDAILEEYISNDKNWPALHYAIEQRRPDIAAHILQIYPEQALELTPSIRLMEVINIKWDMGEYRQMAGYERGFSALELAVKGHYIELAEKLLDLGADVKETHKEYQGYWVSNDEKEVYNALERVPYRETSLLYHAIKGEDLELVELLLQKGAPLEPCLCSKNWWGQDETFTALDIAIETGSETLINKILYYQASGV